mmetsp:Transcript_106667/g.201026  ORF Transcript_106667/g.201026 Transcript_106667/m.201026 type:complete len:142 (-) Transcript_106667:191-616(-)
MFCKKFEMASSAPGREGVADRASPSSTSLDKFSAKLVSVLAVEIEQIFFKESSSGNERVLAKCGDGLNGRCASREIDCACRCRRTGAPTVANPCSSGAPAAAGIVATLGRGWAATRRMRSISPGIRKPAAGAFPTAGGAGQ